VRSEVQVLLDPPEPPEDLHDHQAHAVRLIILQGMKVQAIRKDGGRTGELTSFREINISIV
jgi:hypothetical protein